MRLQGNESSKFLRLEAALFSFRIPRTLEAGILSCGRTAISVAGQSPCEISTGAYLSVSRPDMAIHLVSTQGLVLTAATFLNARLVGFAST